MAFNKPISLVPPSPLDVKQSEHLEAVRRAGCGREKPSVCRAPAPS